MIPTIWHYTSHLFWFSKYPGDRGIIQHLLNWQILSLVIPGLSCIMFGVLLNQLCWHFETPKKDIVYYQNFPTLDSFLSSFQKIQTSKCFSNLCDQGVIICFQISSKQIFKSWKFKVSVQLPVLQFRNKTSLSLGY